MADELAIACGTSTTLDFKKVKSRFEHEGFSFLTITLPAFCKDFEKSLEEGKVALNSFYGFRRRGGLPLFLGGFLERVFERSTGVLLPVPDTDSIYAIRQLTLLFGKILVPCSDARERGAVDRYMQCEQDVKEADRSMSPVLFSEFKRLSVLLFSDLFNEVDREVYDGDLIPKHGPGKTADRLLGNKKFDQIEWPSRLESVFPFGDNALPNWRFNILLDRVHILEPRDERPVKVVLVPKTLKSPRIIAIEPTCMQYMQQALLESLVEKVERSSLLSNLIGFRDQDPNQVLARRGPSEGLATLDLSEASDRVSNQHVRGLVHLWPHLRGALDATRSRKADVPGHGVIRLAKFASMGSALCFPLEAMTFLTVVLLGIQSELRRPLTMWDVKSLHGKVRVYGDDIIVPVQYVESVILHLEAFGLKVNKDKSFWTGKFRESCGKDYYDGVDVSVVRCRNLFPSSRSDVSEMSSLVSLRNQLYFAGLWNTAFWLDSVISPLLGGVYPRVMPSSPGWGRHSYLGYQSEFMDVDLHRPMVKAYVEYSKPPLSQASGEGALLKWFLKRGSLPFANEDHLERQGRPVAVRTKLRSVSVV